MKKVVLALGVLAVSLFANEHSGAVSISDTDFIPRLINFVIFAGILWYLLADKVKEFYANRRDAIATAFSQIEEQLKKSREEVEALKEEVEIAREKAEEIKADAKKEAEVIKAKIIETAKNEASFLNKQLEEYKQYEESKMKREVVENYLNNLVKDIHLSSEEVANIVTKKVG
jgi:F-type H+-transporting ATPase subunit b